MLTTPDRLPRPTGPLPTAAPSGDELAARSRAVLGRNWTGAFTKPSIHFPSGQWTWESGLIAIGYAAHDSNRAMSEIRSSFRGQWTNGMVPHVVFHRPSGDGLVNGVDLEADRAPGEPDAVPTSGLTRPPIQATAVRALVERAPLKLDVLRFVEEMIPKLLASHRFLYSRRDPLGVGLAVCVHPWETVTPYAFSPDETSPALDDDNSTETFPPDDGSAAAQPDRAACGALRCRQLVGLFRDWGYDQEQMAKRSPFRVYDLVFNVVLHRATEDLLELARYLGEPTGEIVGWIRRARAGFESHLWHPGDRRYRSRDLVSGEFLKDLPGPGLAIPLFAGIPDRTWSATVVGALRPPRRESPGEGPPAADDRSEAETDSGREDRASSVRVDLHWMVYQGLRRYGLRAAADRVRDDLVRSASERGFREDYGSAAASTEHAPTCSHAAALVLDAVLESGGNLAPRTAGPTRRPSNVLAATSRARRPASGARETNDGNAAARSGR